MENSLLLLPPTERRLDRRRTAGEYGVVIGLEGGGRGRGGEGGKGGLENDQQNDKP